MTEEIKNGFHFDRSYWPKTESKIPFSPSEGYDLHDLWEKYSDEASIFIAETLIEEKHSSWARFDNGDPYVVTPIWSVGKDLITTQTLLIELIEDCDVYDEIRSEEQAEDVRERIVNMEKLEKKIIECKQLLNKKLADYKTSQEKT